MGTTGYAISLRQELMDVISGIRNSCSYSNWDNTTPNYIIKSRLKTIYDTYVTRAAQFGVFFAERHSCGKPTHTEDYVVILINDGRIQIPYQSEDYVWDGSQIDQGEKICICPCSPKNLAEKHYVIQDVIFSKSSDLNSGHMIYEILLDIYSAMRQSEDNRPRSGIREYILRSILRLNDLILQVPIDEKIAAILSESSIEKNRGQPAG